MVTCDLQGVRYANPRRREQHDIAKCNRLGDQATLHICVCCLSQLLSFGRIARAKEYAMTFCRPLCAEGFPHAACANNTDLHVRPPDSCACEAGQCRFCCGLTDVVAYEHV